MYELTTIIDSYRFKTSVLHGHGYNPPVHGSGLDRQPEIHNSASTPHYNNTSKSVKLKIKKTSPPYRCRLFTALKMKTSLRSQVILCQSSDKWVIIIIIKFKLLLTAIQSL